MSVSLYKPRHARTRTTLDDLREKFGVTRYCGDLFPVGAKCSTDSRSRLDCHAAYCPRHAPEAYAEHMAVHATDSFPFGRF